MRAGSDLRALIAALLVACGADAPHATPPHIEPSADAGAAPDSSVTAAPDAEPEAPTPPLPWEATAFPEPVIPKDNPTTPDKVALGRLLFYDPVFSADGQVACATCHSEDWGMSDGLRVSVGIEGGPKAGPGRSGPNRTRRNSTTLWNVAFRLDAFADGRARDLEDQVRFPFSAPEEFDRPIADVVRDVGDIPEYARRFAEAFPKESPAVTEKSLARAIAAFERTLVSRNALYDAYVAGDTGALSEAMLAGMNLFAELGCPDCHTPPLFSSERFADRGVQAVDGVVDEGRFEVTGVDADRGHFKVPTLRNLKVTGPYFHNGSITLPLEAVRHEVEYSAAHSGSRALSEEELTELSTFILKALFDTGQGPARPLEVPSGLPVPIDGFNVLR